MQTLTKEELFARKEHYARAMLKDVFIYPTDTIYGVGCDATNGVLVDKIRELKRRENMPFSVIAPSKEWVRTVCEVDAAAEEWLEKLPGPYTLILKIKDHTALPHGVTRGKETIGVRMPNHWILRYVKSINTPIITTNANIHGENYMQVVGDLPESWKNKVPFLIDEGEIHNSPSTIVDLSLEEVRVLAR